MSMMTKKEIVIAYRAAKARKIDAENAMTTYTQMHKLRSKIEWMSKKYPDIMWSECPERKKQSVPLAFCIEKCTIKCADFMFVKKHNPRFISLTESMNSTFAKLLNQIEKRVE